MEGLSEEHSRENLISSECSRPQLGDNITMQPKQAIRSEAPSDNISVLCWTHNTCLELKIFGLVENMKSS
jgi:hypothetical protein